MFNLTVKHITRMAEMNLFQVPDEKMFFFGLRGCLPVSMGSLDR